MFNVVRKEYTMFKSIQKDDIQQCSHLQVLHKVLILRLKYDNFDNSYLHLLLTTDKNVYNIFHLSRHRKRMHFCMFLVFFTLLKVGSIQSVRDSEVLASGDLEELEVLRAARRHRAEVDELRPVPAEDLRVQIAG